MSGSEAGTAPELDEGVIEALIQQRQLSQEQVARVRETMLHGNLRFVDAAVHLNLITSDEAASILDPPQNDEAPGSGVFETALRRQSIGRVATVPPAIYVKPSKELLLAHEPDHPHCERIRALRTELALLLGDGGRQASVFAVLSPSPGEGRSQLTAELALAFAQLGRRTLLVEADLRRPRQHQLFGIVNATGMSQCLTYGGSPQMLRVDGVPQLSLLPAGPTPPNPLELLSEGRFEKLLTDWRRMFDVVVIDTPAVAKFADGLAVASFAERVLLLSRSNTTSHKDMKDTLRRLDSTSARILGAVINNF